MYAYLCYVCTDSLNSICKQLCFANVLDLYVVVLLSFVVCNLLFIALLSLCCRFHFLSHCLLLICIYLYVCDMCEKVGKRRHGFSLCWFLWIVVINKFPWIICWVPLFSAAFVSAFKFYKRILIFDFSTLLKHSSNLNNFISFQNIISIARYSDQRSN